MVVVIKKQIYFAQKYNICHKKIVFCLFAYEKKRKNIIKKIILFIYKDNMQIKKKDFSAFYKVNQLFLWFFNIIDYCK